MKLKIVLTLVITLLFLSCKKEKITPENELKTVIANFSDKSSISYKLNYKIKYFDYPDTLNISAQAIIIKQESDSLFGGYIWFSRKDSIKDFIKYYDLNSFYLINNIKKEVLRYNPKEPIPYGFTNNFDGSKFYFYPNITASYNISEEALIAYAGVIGDLQQNSYENFVYENPFVSPTLYIQRTNQQYNAYAGIKGLLNSKIRFNVKAAYISEKDKPLYKLNPSLTDGSNEVTEGYEAGNSFQVIYDDVNTIYFNAEIIFDLWKEFKFGGNLDFNSYSLKNEEQAWNLPLMTTTLLAKYTRKKWSAGADLFFSSDRKDELSIIPDTNIRVTNAAYFDINLNGVYNIDDKFDIFVNVNNILSGNYQVYTNFKVQGLQVFGGVKYKFDF